MARKSYDEIVSETRKRNYYNRANKKDKSYEDIKRDQRDFRQFGPIEPTISTPAPTVTATPTIRTDRWYANQFANKTAANAAQYANRKSKAEMRSGGATAEQYRDNMQRNNTAQFDAGKNEIRSSRVNTLSPTKAGKIVEIAGTKAVEAQMASARRKENQAQANYQQWNDLDNNAKKLVDIAYGGDINNSLDTRIAAENELKTKYNMTNKDLKNVRKGRKEERSRGQSLLEDKRLSKMYEDLGPEGQQLLSTYGSKAVQLLGGDMLRAESLRAENELRTKYRLSDDDLTQLSVYAEQYYNAKNAGTEEKYAQESAAAHPIRTSAATLVTNLIGSVMSKGGQAYEAVNLARLRGSGYNEPVSIDKNNPLFAATRYTNKARETVAEQQFDTKLGSFLYQTGMSLADSAIAAGISKMFPAGSVGPIDLSVGGSLLGMSAGASTMLDLADKGATAEMSLLGGLAAEIFETTFESISISKLDTFSKVEAAKFTKGVSRQVIKDNLKLYAKKLGATTFTNATEEGFTEIANLIYDTIANGGYSQYAEYFNDARKNGATEAQAKTLAIKNMALQVLEAAAGGALMGAVFGVGGGVNLALNYNSFNKGATRLGSMVDATGQRADVVNTAEALPEGSESQRLLNKFTNSKKGLTENRLGRLAIENETYLQNADTDMLKQVEAKRTEIAETKGQNARENFDYYELTNSVVGTDKSGKEIRMVNANVGDTSKGAKIFSKNKNGALTFKTSDGKTMELNKRTVEQIQNPETKALAKSALVYGLGADGTNLLFDTYNPETLTSDHTAAFVRVYRQGALGTQSKALFGTYGEDMDRFTADQQRDILKAGLAEKQTKPGATDWRVAEKNNKFVSLQVKAMNAVAKALSKNGEQKEIFVVDDLYEEYTAKDANGNDVKSYRYLNGQYLTDSGKIIISARADKGLLLSFLGHEMGHEMKVNDINAFNNLAELVESHYGKEEYDKQIQKFTELGYSEEDAKEELICNSLFDVFDKDTIKKVFGRDKAAVVKLYRVLETISNAYNSAMSEYANLQDYKGNLKHADIQKLNNDRELLDGVKEIFTDYLSRMQAGEYKDVKGGAAKNSISDRNRAAENFNELYTLDKDGILKPKNIDDLSTEDWEIIYKTTKRLGYDIRSAADAKQVFGRYVGKYGFNEDQSAAIAKAYGAVNAEETEPASRENPARMLQAEKHYGTTTNFAEAGYLLRDGKMLDFSGYKFGGSRNMRSMDHREIHAVFDTSDSEPYDSNSRYMNAFISEGQIRLMDGQGVTIGELEPTEKQYSLLNKFIERTLKSDDYFAVDIINQNGINIENREYDGDVSPRKIIDDIKYYYKNGEMPYRSELSGFYAKDSVSDRNEQEMVNRLGKNAEVQTDDKGNLVLATDKEKKTAMYSVRTWKDSGRDALANLLRAKGHTQAEIDDQLKTIDDAADYLQILAAGFAENEGYHDLSQHLVADVTTDVAHGKQVVSALVPNGEYPVNIDLALICKKRVAYARLITRLIEDGIMENVRFGGEAIADVNEILRDNGFETACLGCFVESRRLQIQTWAETIAQEWNEAVDKVRKNAPYFNFAQKGKENAGNLTQEEIDDLDAWIAKQERNDKGNVKAPGKTPTQRAGNLLKMAAESGDGKTLDAIAKKITVGDLLTADALTELRSVSGELFSFVKARYGAASPKIVQEFNPYNSEIATMTFKAVKDITGKAITGASKYMEAAKQALADQKPSDKDKAAKEKWEADVTHLALQNYFKDIGGIRIQSFSDFMIENVFDYLQIVADLAAQDFSMHGYTKEITALRLFGMTGIKWNGSWIAHADAKMGKEYAGLMPASEAEAGRGIPVELDGKKYTICMDDYERHNNYDKNSYIQSIGYKDMIALQLDKRYAPYVGSICIGVSDNQIRAMLASPYFRMVIPYHASGMLPEFAKLVGVDLYTDYTSTQNTRLKSVRRADGKEINIIVDKNGKQKAQLIVGKKSDGKPKYAGADEVEKFLFNAKVQELGDAKAAADAYLAWCAEEHPIYNSDGDLVGYATYEPKFEKFSNEPNYYKLLEDFNSYDSVTSKSAVQGGVKMNLPSAENRLSTAELEEYRKSLKETKLFTPEEIDKYAAKAQQTFQEIVQDAVKERARYNSKTVVPKFDSTVKQIEDVLLSKYNRDGNRTQSIPKYLKAQKTKTQKGRWIPLAGTYRLANTSVSGNAKASLSDRGDVADYEAEQYLETASAEEIKAIVDEVDRRMQNAPYFEDKQEQAEVYAILDKMREKRDRLYEALSMDTGNESLAEYNRNTRNEMFGEAEPEGTIEGNKLIGKGQRQNIKKADAEKLIKRYKNVHHDRGTPLSLENLDEATAKLQQFYEDMQNNPNMAWDEVYDKAKDVAVEVIKFTKRHKEVHHPGKIYQQTYNTRYYNPFNDYTDDTGRNYGREAISDSFVLKPGAEEWLAPIINDIVTDYFDVPVSNSDAVKTANLKTTYKNQIQSLKNQIRAIQKEHRAEVKQKVKAQKLADDIYYQKRIKEIRADRDQKLLAQRIAYQRSQQNRREQKAQRDLKGKIYRRYQRLDQELRKPNGNRYVPKDLVNTVAGVLSQITETLQTEEYYNTGRVIKSHVAQNKKLAELKVVYDAMQGNEQYSSYYDPVISEMMQAVADNTKGKTINDMNVSELQQVYNLMTALDHTVRNAAKVEIAGKEHDAFKIADKSIDQLKEVKAKKINRFTKYWYDQMNARSFFRQLSGYTEGGWMDMNDILNEGQLKQSAIKAEVTEAFRELTSDKQARDLMDTKKLYDVGLKDAAGKPIKLTKGMVLAIYMHLQNEQNVRHIAEGGLTVPDLEKYYKGDREAYGTDVTYSSGVAGELRQLNMQINELEKNRTDANAAETDAKIEALEAKKEAAYEKADALMDNLRMQIEKQLTDYDRAWIDKAKWFFDEYSKDKLNEATMQMYGFTKANENNYFPIKVDRDMIAPNFEGLKRDMTLEASGFMKDRQKGAANAIYLEDMVDVIRRQMDNVAAYSGLAPAIKNFNKVYGKSKADDQGNIATVTSVQKAVNSAFGQYGKKYIADLLTDLQGGRKSEPSIISDLRGNAYQAALTLNLRVAMAQAGSYPTAAAEIGWKPLMKALRHGGEKNTVLSKADRELIAKYTPLLANRVNGGNATVDLNNLKTLSAHSRQGVNARILQKTAAATDWISKVDAATVGRLWYAAQYYVDDSGKLEKGTDEYYQEVAKVFNRIVERTQPSYTTMQRSALLRNPNEAVKLFTMYMTQRGQNYNLLYDSIMEYKALRDGAKNGTVSKEKLNNSAVNLRRTVSSQLAAGLTLSAMKIVADAIQHNMKGYRDDDDDEVKAGKILEKLGTTWLESELSNVFLGSEIYSFADRCITGEPYYGISVNVVGAAEDFAKDLKNMFSSPSAKSVDRVFRDAATIMGIPASQMNKFANMGKYWFEDIKDGGGIYSNYEGNETNKQMAGKMVAAYLRGDMAQYRTRSEALNGKSDTSVKSAITSYVEEKVLSGDMSETEARRVFINVYGKSEKETDKKLEEIRQKKAGTYEKKESKKWGG